MSCAQINIVGGNKVQPAGVSFPGAYKCKSFFQLSPAPISYAWIASDPGIVTNIFADTTYTPPGKYSIHLMSTSGILTTHAS